MDNLLDVSPHISLLYHNLIQPYIDSPLMSFYNSLMSSSKQKTATTATPNQAELDPINNPSPDVVLMPVEAIEHLDKKTTTEKEPVASKSPKPVTALLSSLIWTFAIFILASIIAFFATGTNSCSGNYCGLSFIISLPFCLIVSAIIGSIIGSRYAVAAKNSMVEKIIIRFFISILIVGSFILIGGLLISIF